MTVPGVEGLSVVVCLGPGGVGKTTTSAALAIALAQTGQRVVVLTIDPARRLADAMGLDELSNEPRQLSGDWSGEVWAAMLDANATFRSVVEEHAADSAQAERIVSNRLFGDLTSSLSGTHEYMASERLHSLDRDYRFDVVVLDTPPSRHAFDFLDSPGRLVRFVDHPLYRSILAPRQGLMRVVNVAAQMLVRTIGRVVGAQLLDDVVDFFAAFEGMDDGFRARAAEVSDLLTSARTGYVLVTTPRAEAIEATAWIHDGLTERGVKPAVLIANRAMPQSFAEPGRMPAVATSAIDRNLAQLSQVARDEAAMVAELATRLGLGRVVTIDDQAEPVGDIDGLSVLADSLSDA